jgi:ParB-like chromosome segregation protein Spo0J
MKNRRFHPIAAILPLLDERRLAELGRDTPANGLQIPIVVDSSGAIIDGRNRYLACRRVGVQPRYEARPTPRRAEDFVRFAACWVR